MSTSELFWDLVCEFRRVIKIMIVIDLVVLAQMLIPLPFLIRGELTRATTTIAIITYVMSISLLGVLVYFYRRCGARS